MSMLISCLKKQGVKRGELVKFTLKVAEKGWLVVDLPLIFSLKTNLIYLNFRDFPLFCFK